MSDCLSLCRLQLKILKRGLELLEVGGRLVYSTCSMHPVEDEAVIADMLRRCQGEESSKSRLGAYGDGGHLLQEKSSVRPRG